MRDRLWSAANQRYLSAAVATVVARLQTQTAEGVLTALETAEREEAAAYAALPAPARLTELCVRCNLSAFERAILLLCVGIELNAKVAALCAALQGSGSGLPTFGLALATLPDPYWSALTPSAPLRGRHLIELLDGDTLCQTPLRVPECVLHYLIGLPYLDTRLSAYVQPVVVPHELPASQEALVAQVVHFWSELEPRTPGAADSRGIIQLYGDDAQSGLAVAARACAQRGQSLFMLRASELPRNSNDRELLLSLWSRAALLGDHCLLVDMADLNAPEVAEAALSFLERAPEVVLTTAREPLTLRNQTSLRIEVQRATHQEQAKLWQDLLTPLGCGDTTTVHQLVSHFSLSAAGITTAVRGAAARLLTGQAADGRAAVWHTCRSQARVQLDGLARRIEAEATWEDLVLPEAALRTLKQIMAQIRQRLQVYEHWGFARKGQRGLGISAVFAGPSGTGKTLAAEVLANELGLDLYKIDLSQIVSKYIGETEKNLRRIFDGADAGGAILLFDEADALFGKRSEVKDSHDRYANIEVSYLLQRMEEYRGLAILTTNMKNALDEAFLRRLRFVVQFPFPGSAQRADIWSRVFPARTPRETLDSAQLARLTLAGGNIRNIALNAAFLAADQGTPVGRGHLIDAIQSEYEKLERPFNAADLGREK